MSKKLLRCTHGLIWQTCAACCNKTEEEVKKELSLIEEEQHKKLEFDYQDANESQEQEFDTDYDLEDMRMN